MCLHRSRGRCMRIVPLSSLDQNDGRHQLRVGLRTELHNRRTSRTSRLARAHEARITARLYGRRPAGRAQEQHGSELVGEAVRCGLINSRCKSQHSTGNFPWGENWLTSPEQILPSYRHNDSGALRLDSARAKAGRSKHHSNIFYIFRQRL